MKIIWNTKEEGAFHFLLYPENDDFVAICLSLNLIEYGKDPKKLMKSIQEAALAHLEAVRKKNLPDTFLNVPAPKKYWRKLGELQLREKNKPKISVLHKKKPSKIKLEEFLFLQATQGYSRGEIFDSFV